MCGIVGIYNLNQHPVSRGVLKSMTTALAHRGPDADGLYVHENIGLGHRRLSIIDVSSKANQPMQSKDGRWVVVFNGCIYNYLELKIELRSKGVEFNSSSDTEVLVEGIAHFGIAFIERLNGMFAIGAYDLKERKLHLLRDRYGIKPLYYWFNGATLLFASEIKAFLQFPEFKVEVNKDILNEYFSFQNVFRYHTMFNDVVLLPPANSVEIQIESTKVKHHSWWDYDFSQPDESMTFEEAKEQTKHLMEQAIERQLVADVPVGSYLSGGMDSGSITSIASRSIPRLATFTCGFDMSSVTGVEANYDERRDAEMISSYFKTEHYEQVINSGDIKWSLPRVVWHLEDLRVGMSYPNYYISRLASKFVKVCLQGTGGDELYGGYPWRYYRVYKSLNQNDFFNEYYQFWQRLVPDADKYALFTENVKNSVDLSKPRRSFERVFLFNEKLKYDTPEDHIQNSMYFEIKTFLHGLFVVGDKLSMANGLEERFPFMDNDLVDFAMKIPVRHKLGNLEDMKKINENSIADKKRLRSYREFDDGKNVLRKAMVDFLPQSVLNRKKQGFSAPDESWYRGENANYIKEVLQDKNAMYREYIDTKYVNQILQEHFDHKANHRLLIWSLLNFETWLKIFVDGQKIYQ